MNRQVRLKSQEEIVARLRELVSRYRRRFIHRNLRPCPYNCQFSTHLGNRISGCSKCGSRNPEFCKDQTKFSSAYSKDELARHFSAMLNDPQVLLQDYRDVVAFLFVLGYFDKPQAVPEHLIQPETKK